MLNKFLIKIVDNVVGRLGDEIVSLLHKKKDVNEFKIAKKLKLTINQTRNILYKLSDVGLITFIRKKDKRKGWYTYFWTLNIKNSLEYLKKFYLNNLGELRNQLKSREIKRFYQCQYCGIEMTEENALNHNFTCKECGEVYELVDNTRLVKELKNKIDKIEKEIESIDIELDIVNQAEKKKLEKEAIKEKSDKKIARKKAAKKRLAEKKKLEKDTLKIKKKSVKKSVKKVKKKIKKVKKKSVKKVKGKKVGGKVKKKSLFKRLIGKK